MDKEETNTGYGLIPMSEITDEAREIAVLWAEGNGHDWIGDKHKLASDIINYAKKQTESLQKTISDQQQRISELEETLREANVLTGEDARRFEEQMNSPRELTTEERESLKRSEELMKKILVKSPGTAEFEIDQLKQKISELEESNRWHTPERKEPEPYKYILLMKPNKKIVIGAYHDGEYFDSDFKAIDVALWRYLPPIQEQTN